MASQNSGSLGQQVAQYPFKIKNVALVERYSSRRNALGALHLTSNYLIFVDHENERETWVLLSHICSVVKLALTPTGSPLQIRTKTFLSLTFVIPKERDAHEFYTALTAMCQPEEMEGLYCFSYKMEDDDEGAATGRPWKMFPIQADYERMGVPNDDWTLTNVNRNYALCDTYPEELYVPTSASTDILTASSKFRSRGRLPVLTYLHHNKSALCRCSQPLSGFKARCVEDEKLFRAIGAAAGGSGELLVVDTRPRINAIANRAAGKGYESEANYEKTKFLFAPIDNIHVMRSSLARLLESCDELKTGVMGGFLNGSDGCSWLKHVKAILDAAQDIALKLDEGVTVVVHCSDGWDRTAQVCGMAQLMLDPYYRTVHGLEALISKEWLAFGHKFSDRCGHIQGDPKEVSPIFTQWLDCIWQLMEQKPALFQFNSKLLLLIHDHVHSCQYGTFIGNCIKDRIDLRVEERTYSLWSYVANHMNDYLNPLYNAELNDGFVQFNFMPQNIRLWREMYCRWESGLHPRESLSELSRAARDHISSMQDHIRLLERLLASSNEKQQKVPEALYESSDSESKTKDNVVLTNEQNSLSPTQWDPLCNNKSFIHHVKMEDNPGTSEEEDLTTIFSSVALDWRSLRGLTQCPCSTPLDFATAKSHCWRCGDVFCSRCLKKWLHLPGHLSMKKSPVCPTCSTILTHPNSIQSPL